MDVHNYKIFMHDEVSCHKSKIAKKFLQTKYIQVHQCPGNSFEFNPINNLWTVPYGKVTERRPASLVVLKNTKEKVWVNEITPYYHLNLVSSLRHDAWKL